MTSILERVQETMQERKHEVRVNLRPRYKLSESLGADFTPIDLRQARLRWKEHRVAYGLAAFTPTLLTAPEGNLKLDKTQAYGLSLAPANLSGNNVCTHSTIGCRNACLNLAGKGMFSTTQARRIVKTRFLYEDPRAFATLILHEIDNLHNRFGKDLRIRLNVLSDIRWEEVLPQAFAIAPLAQFYDYTKDLERVLVGIGMPKNYKLAVSASERMDENDVRALVNLGNDVAVVFSTMRGHKLPRNYAGQHVTDADLSDAWMLMRPRQDGRGRVGGLRAKARAIGDTSGFVKSPLGS